MDESYANKSNQCGNSVNCNILPSRNDPLEQRKKDTGSGGFPNNTQADTSDGDTKLSCSNGLVKIFDNLLNLSSANHTRVDHFLYSGFANRNQGKFSCNKEPIDKNEYGNSKQSKH